MATYYVDSNATGGSNTGGSFANAYLALASALTAATGNGDVIKIAHNHVETFSGADKTWTFGANISLICVNSSTEVAVTTPSALLETTNSKALFMDGAKTVYIYGVKIQSGSSMGVGYTAGAHFELEQCLLYCASGLMILGLTSGGYNRTYVKLKKCGLKYGGTGVKLYPRNFVELEGCNIDSGGSAPTALIDSAAEAVRCRFIACDLSHITGTLVPAYTSAIAAQYEFINCKLGSGVVIAAAADTELDKSNRSVYVFNCQSGDYHYTMAHYDAFGETTVGSLTADGSSIYCNDGAEFQTSGTGGVSWKIVTTANCSYYTPYVSPWISVHHEGTSAITPYLEILRDGSATAYQNDEVWAEFMFQGTTGYTLGTIDSSDRMTPLGSPADQTSSSLGASSWTGENATAWFGKLSPTASITPAELGDLCARVCVGEPSITVYVDPTIRGRS